MKRDYSILDKKKDYSVLDWYCPRCWGRMEEDGPSFYLRCKECGERKHVDDCLTFGQRKALLEKER
jgi:tRNA(Ile2) C34 agmatinyltransferase TiaS